ncbi:MAG: xanthine dehydrogenase family protein molybdopterin-binding subunit, partial [Rhodocyclales bacterium]|nr:xanthine dehydrogenase family protein molybdopterin-binding subunit [Rhodocyclales bacterium]
MSDVTNDTAKIVGQGIDRADGRLKVCGAAKYSAEWSLPRMAYGLMVLSSIPSGRIARIDTQAAERTAGVIGVLSHLNAPKLPKIPPQGRVLSLLQDDQVHYNQQPIAVVIADTLEHARDGVRALQIEYAKSVAQLDFAAASKIAYSP